MNEKDKYFCIVRKSFITATPEEEVRQYFLKFLIEQKKIPIEKIRVEQSLAHYGKGIRRVDILVLDENDSPYIIYECKRPLEPITDEIIDQVQDYYDKLNTVQYIGLVIGDDYKFIGRNKETGEPIYFSEHPDYFSLINNENLSIIEPESFKYERNNWKTPVDKDVIQELIENGVIGNGTLKKYHSFLINLDGWLLDINDKLVLNENIEDIGIKNTKFGSAGGGFFANQYRSFLLKNEKNKPIVSIAINAIRSSQNVDFGTCIYVGIETTLNKNSALQLRVSKSISIEENKVNITHNGTMTVGKLGAIKRKELIEFILKNNSNLVKNDKIYLAEFNQDEEINSNNIKVFIQNIIEYALLRNKFREIKKKAVANNG